MLNNTNDILAQLKALHFSNDEAKIYVELASGSYSTHLQLSRSTGVNRTKVYRIVQQLESRSLVARRTDDRGTFLVVTDPSTLEVSLATQEEDLKRQHAIVKRLVPALSSLQEQNTHAFVVRVYEGQAGFKQMLWHELKTQGDIVALGNGTIEQLATDARWANHHRDRQIAAGYKTRDIVNFEYTSSTLPPLASKKLAAAGLYSYRTLSPAILQFDSQTVIYNHTVAIYHWKHDQKVGIEIISPAYSHMMRNMFEHFWQLAADPPKKL